MKTKKIIRNSSPFSFKNNEFLMIYNDEFVGLLNGLNESIKEYSKVSKINIAEANNCFSFYEKLGKSMELLIEEMNNTNSYEKINEVIGKISRINEIMSSLQMNTNSNNKNLSLFLEDAKIVFKKMKMKRKEKIQEINNYNANNSSRINDSFSRSFNFKQQSNLSKQFLMKNNYKIKKIIKKNSEFLKKTNPDISSLQNINKISSQIAKLINELTDFTLIIKEINPQASDKYNHLQINIKKYLDILMKIVKSSLLFSNNITEKQVYGSVRNKSVPKEIEQRKKINPINWKKNFVLNSQLNINKNNIFHTLNNEYDIKQKTNTEEENKIQKLQNQINNLKISLINSKKQIHEKDKIIMNLKNISQNITNTSIDMNKILKIKDNQIINLQQKLKLYKNNEDNQIMDLDSKFQAKSNQNKIKNKEVYLPKTNLNNNKEIINLKNANLENKKEIKNLKKTIYNNSPKRYEATIQILYNEINNYKNMIIKYRNKIGELSKNINEINMNNKLGNKNTNNQNNSILVEQKMKIYQLTKEIVNYKKKEKLFEEKNNIYLQQFEELNNNMIYLNQILEQKDELIKQLNDSKKEKNSYNLLKLKKEKDVYQFQFEQMEKKYNNLKKLLEEKNLNSQNKNNDMIKIELINMQLENEKLKKSISELQEINNNLLNNQFLNGNEIVNKNNLIMQINELSQENLKYKEISLKANEDMKKLEENINKKNEELDGLKSFIFKLQSQLEKKEDLLKSQKFVERNDNLVDKNKNGTIIVNFPSPSDPNTEMVNNILNKLNDAEKTISSLQNKNRNLKRKLEEKENEKEILRYKTEGTNVSNNEEEYDMKKIEGSARQKNMSEDINIDYPGNKGLKEKYKELMSNNNSLQEQIKILICNINCNNKIKNQIDKICQLMKISSDNIQMILSGKDKRKALGLKA